jgi:hypothetical protein
MEEKTSSINTKTYQWFKFSGKVDDHIREYVIPQYGDFPDKTIGNWTPEKIQAKLEAYVDRIGKSSRGKEDSIIDCFKIAHFACYLYFLLTTGSSQPITK